MIAYSKNMTQKDTQPLSTPLLLQHSLQRTALCFSLDHSFQPEKNIDKIASGIFGVMKVRIASWRGSWWRWHTKRRRSIFRSIIKMGWRRWMNYRNTINTTRKLPSTISPTSIKLCTTIGSRKKLSSIIDSKSCLIFRIPLTPTLRKHPDFKIHLLPLSAFSRSFKSLKIKSQSFSRSWKTNCKKITGLVDLILLKNWTNSIVSPRQLTWQHLSKS